MGFLALFVSANLVEAAKELTNVLHLVVLVLGPNIDMGGFGASAGIDKPTFFPCRVVSRGRGGRLFGGRRVLRLARVLGVLFLRSGSSLGLLGRGVLAGGRVVGGTLISRSTQHRPEHFEQLEVLVAHQAYSSTVDQLEEVGLSARDSKTD